MKSNVIALFLALLLSPPASGQGVPSSILAKAFAALGPAKVLNEIFIPDVTNPKIVALLAGRSSESITILSISQTQVRTVWHLPQIPDFMSGISPHNLRVLMTDYGPVVLLHGCAAHLCGGKGLAGALAYVVNEHRIYTAYASYDSSTKTTKFVYSPEDTTPGFEAQKKLLDGMLREEHYNP